jgi:hypothetical protein
MSMDRLCPRCRGTTRHLLCPRCGVRTTDPAAPASSSEFTHESASPASGFLVGLLLAQGLYYALRHLATAWLLATGNAAAEADFWDNTVNGLVTSQALQGSALLIGGMMAAAGQRRGLVIGASLGAVNGLLLLALNNLKSPSAEGLTLYGLPVLHAFVGAAAGVIGSRVWQAAPGLPPLAGDGRVAQESLTTILPDRPIDVIVEPWPWSRLLLGIVIAVGGTLGARLIREWVVVAGGGTGREMQSQFITWEIALFTQVIGGAIAGAVTRGGAIYGFWVGLPTALILSGAQLVPDLRVPAQVVPAWLMGPSVPDGSPIVLAFQAVQTVVLGTLGGWLGGLILPADPGRRRDAF